jgi:fido (protein-threonine AMPylation protein)
VSGPDYSAAQAEAARFCYPDSNVLINRAGLSDQAQLDAFERAQVARKLRSLRPFDPTSYAAFKAVHLHLFGSVYAWAGQERTYTTSRGAASFARAEFIAGEMEKRFTAIRTDAALTLHDRDSFAARAAEHIGEINAIHPFLEGNGRMQRVLLQALAGRAGFAIALDTIDQPAWYAAAAASFEQQDYAPLTALIRDNLSDLLPPPKRRLRS